MEGMLVVEDEVRLGETGKNLGWSCILVHDVHEAESSKLVTRVRSKRHS